MVKTTLVYSLGDYVIHRNYGVGQINGIESRPFNGAQVECFKVKTENGEYWFPIDDGDNPRVRSAASNELVLTAIEILQRAPHGLENGTLEWKERIDDVQDNGGFLDISRLVRDLFGLKTHKRLNRTQQQALINLQNRLLMEWSATVNVSEKTIKSKLKTYLQVSNANFLTSA